MAEVNQQLIADRLGLSRATVSRCFTNHAGISPITRAKVFQMATELGYAHQENRTSSTQKSRPKLKFNVLICADKDEFYNGKYQSPGQQILAGVSEYAQKFEATIEIDLVSPGDPKISQIDSLKRRKNRGVLLIYPFPSELVTHLALKFPIVSLVDQHDLDTFDNVDVNHNDGISNIVDHLVELGHQQIGFYTKTYPVEASWSFRRYSAFVEKMARLNLKVSPKDIIGMYPRREMNLDASFDEAARRTQAGVTAWICAADHQAYDLIEGLNERNLNVPDDVSVTGFDGVGSTLTTINIPYREIGITGSERLAARINKRFRGKQNIYISGKLHSGETTSSITP